MSAFWAAIASGALRGKEPERKGWQITLRDDSLPHQIRLSYSTPPGGGTMEIAVSCNCRRIRHQQGGAPGYEPLESRTRWEPDEPIEVWRRHMAAVNAA